MQGRTGWVLIQVEEPGTNSLLTTRMAELSSPVPNAPQFRSACNEIWGLHRPPLAFFDRHLLGHRSWLHAGPFLLRLDAPPITRTNTMPKGNTRSLTGRRIVRRGAPASLARNFGLARGMRGPGLGDVPGRGVAQRSRHPVCAPATAL
jgi:hypothetical protein